MKDPGQSKASRMALLRHIGTCLPFFLLAVTFDLLGLVLLFVGIFGDLRVRGLFYGDFLIYSGSIIIFASLACWLMWYVGNIRVSEPDGRKRNSLALLATKISERLSQKMKGDDCVDCVDREDCVDCVKCVAEDEDRSHAGTPPLKPGKVTWGKSTAYLNEGYDGSTDGEQCVG